MTSLSSKKNYQPQLFHLQSASVLYVLEKVLDYFALIRFQGTLRCQESSPNQALASRSTHITATNHVGNVHKKHLRKFLVKVFRYFFSVPKGGPPSDSQTGWFPRNFRSLKCQLCSWKPQFKLKLSHGAIVLETKNLQPQLFHP